MTIFRNYNGAWHMQVLTTCFLMLCQSRTLFGEICQFPAGSNTVDLTNMHTVEYNTTAGNIYKYNCAGIDAVHPDVVICQQWHGDTACSIPVGKQSTEKVEYSDGVLVITYSASSSSTTCPSNVRIGIVNVVCGPETFVVTSEDSPSCTYTFKLATKKACFSSSGGMAISVGTLLLILFFLFIVIYLVAGMLINHFVFDAIGVEMIPNLEFWKDFPALVADGFRFVFRKCRRNDQTYDRI